MIKKIVWALVFIVGFTYPIQRAMPSVAAEVEAEEEDAVESVRVALERECLGEKRFFVRNNTPYPIFVRQGKKSQVEDPAADNMYHIDYRLAAECYTSFTSNGTFVWFDVKLPGIVEKKSIAVRLAVEEGMALVLEYNDEVHAVEVFTLVEEVMTKIGSRRMPSHR